MNKETKLLGILDNVFGMENKIKSEFRKVGPDFDERTNEHVFYIEYRVRGKGGLGTTPRLGKRKPKKKLLGQINDRVVTGVGFPLVTNIQPYSYLDNGGVVRNQTYGPLKTRQTGEFMEILDESTRNP